MSVCFCNCTVSCAGFILWYLYPLYTASLIRILSNLYPLVCVLSSLIISYVSSCFRILSNLYYLVSIFYGYIFFEAFVLHSGMICRPSESLLWEALTGIQTLDWTGCPSGQSHLQTRATPPPAKPLHLLLSHSTSTKPPHLYLLLWYLYPLLPESFICILSYPYALQSLSFGLCSFLPGSLICILSTVVFHLFPL